MKSDEKTHNGAIEDPDQIRKYLSQHPDFFVENSDLLTELNLPHGENGAISLVEKQVSMLRERDKASRVKLDEFLKAAKRNDDIFKKSQFMILGLVEASDRDSILKNLEKGFKRDGSQFDKLFNDGESFYIGEVLSSYISTPGHTPACGCYKIEDNIFVGDTLFMPDFGTARCDFPGGDARTMYKSIRRILEHHSQTVLWMCHDYLPNGRSEYQSRTTVGAQRENNPHVNDGISEDMFVQLREKKDSLLGFPKLLIPSIQVNMRAGDLPPKEENGTSYIKIPINKI